MRTQHEQGRSAPLLPKERERAYFQRRYVVLAPDVNEVAFGTLPVGDISEVNSSPAADLRPVQLVL